MPTLTKYVDLRYMANGDGIYSFKMNRYLRDQLAKVPDDTYIKLGPSQYSDSGFALYWQEDKRDKPPVEYQVATGDAAPEEYPEHLLNNDDDIPF